jgi:hypothetical protein
MRAGRMCNPGQICKRPSEMLALHLTWIFKNRVNVLSPMLTTDSMPILRLLRSLYECA